MRPQSANQPHFHCNAEASPLPSNPNQPKPWKYSNSAVKLKEKDIHIFSFTILDTRGAQPLLAKSLPFEGVPNQERGKKGKKKKKSHPPPKQTNIISSSVISQNATTNRDNKTISLPTTPRPQRNRLNLGREGLSLFNPALHPQRP